MLTCKNNICSPLAFSSTALVIFLTAVQLFVISSTASAGQVLISSGIQKYQIGPSVEFLKDESGTLGISEVSSLQFSDRFVSDHQAAINLGITDIPYWLRFTLKPTGTTSNTEQTVGRDLSPSDWLLYFGKHLDFYDEIRVYTKTAGENLSASEQPWHQETFGMDHAVAKNQRDPLVIRLSLPTDPGEELLVYLRVQMVGGFFIEPTLYSPREYHQFTKRLALFYGCYYGIVLSMILVNLFHYLFLRDTVRLLYIAYAVSICFYFLVANELGLTLFPVSFLTNSRMVAQLLGVVTMAQIVYFTIAFLDTRQTMVWFHWLLHAVAAVSASLVLLFPFLSYYELAPVISSCFNVVILVIIIAGFTAWVRGFRPARFFLLAWLFFIAGGVIYSLNFRGIFPYPFLGNNALQAGSAIEMILLSIATADRVKYMIDNLNRAQSIRQERLNALTRKIVVAEEQERQRIAEVLHDSIGQILFATKWEVERLLKSLNRKNGTDTDVLSHLDTCISETRNLTAELYPHELNVSGLKHTLELQAKNLSNRFNTKVTVLPGKEPEGLEKELKFFLHRATLELLHNVFKHAGAKTVEISLATKSDCLSLSVKDDGVGFDYPVDNTADSGLGLFSISERLKDIEGVLQVERDSSGGSIVTIKIPLFSHIQSSI